MQIIIKEISSIIYSYQKKYDYPEYDRNRFLKNKDSLKKRIENDLSLDLFKLFFKAYNDISNTCYEYKFDSFKYLVFIESEYLTILIPYNFYFKNPFVYKIPVDEVKGLIKDIGSKIRFNISSDGIELDNNLIHFSFLRN